MKYRAAATQIKEIPVIFRGTVNHGSSIVVPISTYDKEIAKPNFEGEGNFFGYSPSDMIIPEGEAAVVNYNGTIYTAEKKEGTYGSIYYGAPIDWNDSPTMDSSEYPFTIITYPDYPEDPAYFCIAVKENVTIHVNIINRVPQPGTKIFSSELTGNGQIKRFHCRFALGENGTLHIKPYVILNGNIRVDLCAFASNGDNYISGDNEEIAFDCYVPVETHAVAYVEAENVGEYDSILDAAIVVQYEDYIEPESIIGYEGINLRRGK